MIIFIKKYIVNSGKEVKDSDIKETIDKCMLILSFCDERTDKNTFLESSFIHRNYTNIFLKNIRKSLIISD